MDIFEVYMKFVGFLQAILEHYTRIHYFIYKFMMRGDLSLKKFYLSDENVGLWILTAFSIVICFSLIFIPLKGTSGRQRKERLWIRRIVPFGIVLAPFPMVIYFVIGISYIGNRILRLIYNPLSNIIDKVTQLVSKSRG